MAKKTGRNIATWIILGLLFVGLVGFGATGLSGNVRSLGRVGDKDLSIQRYVSALQAEMRAFGTQIGVPISFPQAQSIGLDQAVLNRLITERVIDNEAARLGLSAGDEIVARVITADPTFQGLDGAFDRERYRFVLRESGLTEAGFETAIREDLARTILQGAVVGGVVAPEVYVDTLTAFIGEARSFSWVEVTELSDPLPDPTEEELLAFYEANPEMFTSPEIKVIDYAWLTPDMIMDEVELDEAQLRELYEQRIDEFVRPERRLVERLVFADEAAAEAAMERIRSGEIDFPGLVAERGLSLSDADMGDVTEDDLGDAGPQVFASFPGQVVGPLPSPLGPALYRMNAVLAAQETTFEEALPDLREELARERAARIIDAEREGIEDLIAGGAGPTDLPEVTAMEPGRIEWTTDSQDGIAAYASFGEAAFVAQPGDFPELFELEDGGIFVLSVAEVRPPALRPFEEVRDEVARAWEAEARRAALLAEAEALAEAVREAGSFTPEMPAPSAEVALTRRNFVQGTPQGFMEAVFDMDEPGEVIVVPGETGGIVVQLTEILPADPDDPDLAAQSQALAERAVATISQDIYAAWAGRLRESTDVQIDTAALNAVHAQFQ